MGMPLRPPQVVVVTFRGLRRIEEADLEVGIWVEQASNF